MGLAGVNRHRRNSQPPRHFVWGARGGGLAGPKLASCWVEGSNIATALYCTLSWAESGWPDYSPIPR
jgi:hypothetical protein